MNNKNIKVGCEILLIKDDAILLGKRRNCYGEGTWALPGGHLEQGESIRECARRELKEELDIEGLEFRLISVADSINERGHYVHISFLLEKFLGEIRNMESDLCYEWKFFSLSSLPEELFNPHKNILKNYFENVLYIERKY
jgi:8-oxo-dGTP diphosphatase